MRITPWRLSIFPALFILYEFSGNMSNDMFLPAFPEMAANLAASANAIQTTIGAWLVGLAAAQTILGALCDRFGRRPVLFGGGLVFLLATLACGIAPDIGTLVIARSFQGFGVGSMMIAGYASIHDLYDDTKATHILAWTSSAGGVAAAIGPLAGSFVLLIGTWRLIFYILTLIALISLVGLFGVMPESLKGQRQSLHPMVLLRTYGRLLRHRAFTLRCIAFGFLQGGMMLWITASPYLIMEHFGLTPRQFGYLQIPVFVAFIIGARFVKPALRWWGAPRSITIGQLVSLVSGLAMLFLPGTLAALVTTMSIFALGFGLAVAPLTRDCLTATEEARGVATAMFFLLMTGTGAFVSFIISSLPDTALTVSILLLSVGACSLLSKLGAGKKTRRLKQSVR